MRASTWICWSFVCQSAALGSGCSCEDQFYCDQPLRCDEPDALVTVSEVGSDDAGETKATTADGAVQEAGATVAATDSEDVVASVLDASSLPEIDLSEEAGVVTGSAPGPIQDGRTADAAPSGADSGAVATDGEGLTDTELGTTDTVPSGTSLSDSGPHDPSEGGAGPQPRCNPEAPFDDPVAVAAINQAGIVENAILSPNGLAAYVRYGNDPTTYVATRDAIMDEFGPPTRYPAFDALLADNELLELEAISADGLTVYWSNGVNSQSSVRSSHRTSVEDGFEQITIHEELADEGLPLLDPWVSLDGQRLYAFVFLTYRLVVAESGADSFSQAVLIGDQESLDSSIYSSILAANEETLYATVNNVGGAFPVGSAGVARATRNSMSESFTAWQLVDALDGPGWDQPIWVSEDECEIVVRQDAEEAGIVPTQASDLVVARRGM